jgi:hypothetical protein
LYTGIDNRRYQIDQSNQGASLAWDGGSDNVAVSGDSFTSPCPMALFAMNSAGTIDYTSRVAFAEVKVWSDYADETSLVLHLKPAVRDGKCGFLNILEGGKFYPNNAESGDDFEVFYHNLKVLSVSEVKSKSRVGLFMFVR